MKPKFHPRLLWKLFAYSLLIIILHVTDHARCRPQSPMANGTHLWQRSDKASRSESRRFILTKVKRSTEYKTGEEITNHDRTMKLLKVDDKSPDMMDPDVLNHREPERFISYLADDLPSTEEWQAMDDDYTGDIVIEGTDLVEIGTDFGEMISSPDDATLKETSTSSKDIEEPVETHKLRHVHHSDAVPGMRKLSSASDDDEEDVNTDSRSLSRQKRLMSSTHRSEGSSRDEEPVLPSRGSRKHRRRHRRKHKQRLLLKSKDTKNRERFPLRSEGPSYLITSANEIKKDWCKTIPLKQKITEPNCRTKEIMNNFCYGQCNSFFIPHPGRTATGSGGNPAMNRVAFQSCAVCKPHRFKWADVVLHCPGQTVSKVSKRVFVVESCRCKNEVIQ